MKKMLLLCMMMFSLHAGEAFWYDSYKEAAQTAKEEHKAMLIFMSQAGCKSCEYMEDNVLFKDDIAGFLDENYIAVHLDIHDNDAPKKLQIGMTPVFYFLDENEKELREMLVGGKKAPQFFALLKEAVSKK